MKTTDKNNRLIAEFMGAKTKTTILVTIGKRMTEQEIWLPIHGIVDLNKLKYHTSWDWLMPVVEKIENLENNLKNETREEFRQFQKVLSLPVYSKIEVVYQAVVEFIEWYNKQSIS